MSDNPALAPDNSTGLQAPAFSSGQLEAWPLSVSRLGLQNFRNYSSLSIDFGPEPVVLTGHNGAGKTNILEAISLLVPGKGLRGAKTTELDKQGADGPWIVSADLRTAFGKLNIHTTRSSEGDKRTAKMDGQARPVQELASQVSLCFVTPQMDQIFLGGASSRRGLLDRLVTSFSPDHARHLNSYDYSKSERMRLLKSRRADSTWLSTLEQRMAEHAIAIAAARIEVSDLLSATIRDHQGAFPKAVVSVAGSVEGDVQDMPALRAEELLAARLKTAREQDAASGRTSEGTHTSDFVVYHADKNQHAELCSTGEQKALLLSIMLSSCRANLRWRGLIPLLLLDEMVAHLDAVRRAALFAEIRDMGAQSWMTGTDPLLFSDFSSSARFLSVENSTLLG